MLCVSVWPMAHTTPSYPTHPMFISNRDATNEPGIQFKRNMDQEIQWKNNKEEVKEEEEENKQKLIDEQRM